MIDSTTWYLAYFYPRVAVFDDYNGWDTMPFTDVQEFYSDFNDYDVAITAPANYVVWGTGTLLNPSDVLSPQTLQRYNQSFTSDQTITVASRADGAGAADYLAIPCRRYPGHDLQSQRPLRLGCSERRRG
jgi:hypothetical protein